MGYELDASPDAPAHFAAGAVRDIPGTFTGTSEPATEASTEARLAAEQLHAAGYRGFGLLRDPIAGLLIVFASVDAGCIPFFAGDIERKPGETPAVTTLPDLRLKPVASGPEVFEAVQREMRKIAGWTVE